MLNCCFKEDLNPLYIGFNTGCRVVMVTWNVKELLLFTFDGREKKWKNTKFNDRFLSKIAIHHCLPFVGEQRSVNCQLFPFLPRPFPRPLPLLSPNFVLALMGIVQSDLLAKGNRKGLLRRLTFLLLLICWRACVDLKVEGEFGKIENDDMCT